MKFKNTQNFNIKAICNVIFCETTPSKVFKIDLMIQYLYDFMIESDLTRRQKSI